jgi:hypothetical protein
VAPQALHLTAGCLRIASAVHSNAPLNDVKAVGAQLLHSDVLQIYDLMSVRTITTSRPI